MHARPPLIADAAVEQPLVRADKSRILQNKYPPAKLGDICYILVIS